MSKKTKGRIVLLCVYLIAFSTGFLISTLTNEGILYSAAVAVLASVAVIYAGSFIFNNSSVFDPYWSLAPPLMVIFFVAGLFHTSQDNCAAGYGICDIVKDSPRIIIMFLLTLAYAIRLTWNFLHHWPGLHHEDWRYVDFRMNTGKSYWIVSLSAIHLFPALMVFGGTLSVWVAVVHGYRQTNLFDLAALIVTGYAIFLEAKADRQLRNFLARNKEAGKTMDQGLWSWSRHPNYLGEILFWWGLYLFAIAANPSFWWVIIGPLAITFMFIFASIPMIEKRMLVRRKDYQAYMNRVNRLIPWKFPKK